MASESPVEERSRCTEQSVESERLPVEILIYIFKDLELQDRKNVRLACHRWYDACNCPKILKKEKFVFRYGTNDVEDIRCLGVCILKCKTVRTHVEFHLLRVTHFWETIWEHCGRNIQSLFIFGSHVDNATFKNIVIHCPNLRYFCLKNDTSEFFPESAIDELLAQKIERRELISFEVYGNSSSELVEGMNRMWQNIFYIYPCIRTFGEGLLTCDFLLEEGGDPSETWVFPPLIENFTSARPITASWEMPSHIKFKGFSTMLNIYDMDINAILDFFSGQTELEKLRLYLCVFDESREIDDGDVEVDMEIFAIKLLLGALKMLPKLKEIEFQTHGEISFTITEFIEFLKCSCHLESLSFVSKAFYLTADDFDERLGEIDLQRLPSVEYTNLKKLLIESIINSGGTTEERFIFEILKRCSQSLEYLDLSGIFFDHPHSTMIPNKVATLGGLRTLKIGLSATTVSDPYLTFENLRNLQHLSLAVPWQPLKNLLSKFNFPDLKYFHISVIEKYGLSKKEIWTKVLDVVSRDLLRLEILSISDNIDKHILNVIKLPQYCKMLRRLQYLRISETVYSNRNLDSFSASKSDRRNRRRNGVIDLQTSNMVKSFTYSGNCKLLVHKHNPFEPDYLFLTFTYL